MLTIEIELLTGRYVAQLPNDRDRVEWPPHPARLFSALVAAHAARGKAPEERRALLAFEQLPPPEIIASNVWNGRGRRTVNPVFVPVNDTALTADAFARAFEAMQRAESAAKKKAAANRLAQAVILAGAASQSDLERAADLLPAGRPRQQRTFPSISPDFSRVWLRWPDAELDANELRVLGGLLDSVTALGHSSSLVRCTLHTHAPSIPNELDLLVPRPGGRQLLRWVAPGQLERLDTAFEHHEGVRPRVLPALPVAYGRLPDAARPPAESVWQSDGWLVLTAQGGHDQPRFHLTRAVDIAKALHGALVKHGPQPPPPLISGRGANGQPLEQPHLALLPLPDVGHPHAHGGVMGVAIVTPSNATPTEAAAVIDALAGFLSAGGTLTLPRGAKLALAREEFPEARALQEPVWTGPSRQWATATPIALDRNPGDLNTPEGFKMAAKLVTQACVNIRLPPPVGVELSLAPYLAGSRPVRSFDVFPRERGRLRRLRVHALIDFGTPVTGPLVLGAGRYFGLGLCRPLGA